MQAGGPRTPNQSNFGSCTAKLLLFAKLGEVAEGQATWLPHLDHATAAARRRCAGRLLLHHAPAGGEVRRESRHEAQLERCLCSSLPIHTPTRLSAVSHNQAACWHHCRENWLPALPPLQPAHLRWST